MGCGGWLAQSPRVPLRSVATLESSGRRGRARRSLTPGEPPRHLVVILGTGGITVGKMWDFLEATFTGQAKELVREIRRIERPRGFLLTGTGVENLPTLDLVARLAPSCRRMGWGVRVWGRRKTVQVREPQGPLWGRSRALLLSWNINRWTSKRAEFAHYIGYKHPMFICVQETWCKETDWRPRVKGYTVYHTDATDQAGCNGIMVMTRNDVKAGRVEWPGRQDLGLEVWWVRSPHRPPIINLRRPGLPTDLACSVSYKKVLENWHYRGIRK